MGKSKIEWTDYTFNPWIGCVKVSDGCKNCYAEMWAERYPKWRNTWGVDGERIKTSDAYWRKPLTWNAQAKAEGKQRKVFCGSLCDIFEEREDLIAYRDDLFDLIARTPNLDWLLLTKRPENIMDMTPIIWEDDWPDNVWIGTSVENQEQADRRVPELLKAPASVRFLSAEPLLGPIEFSDLDGIDWVIVGGESGPNKRPFHIEWAEDILAQCRFADVPFFFKQIDKVKEIPDHLLIREFPYVSIDSG